MKASGLNGYKLLFLRGWRDYPQTNLTPGEEEKKVHWRTAVRLSLTKRNLS